MRCRSSIWSRAPTSTASARRRSPPSTTIPRVLSVDELLADPDVDLVVNLTIPQAHVGVSRAALDAGKSVYCEKPLALTVKEGRELVAAARSKGLRIGCAPDTFLGAGLQTCRGLIDSGAIGEPLGANAFMLSPGPEALASAAADLLRVRRRPDVRHGSVLPHRAGHAARSGAAHHQFGAHLARGAHHRQRTAERATHQSRGADARRQRHRFRCPAPSPRW